ncbi:MAG: glycosyltransferase family 39 protein [Candidatus Erginobacter occultus]|nr:glycosyltransferase family 39 protein [Candidatus Erginobacter occultus]
MTVYRNNLHRTNWTSSLVLAGLIILSLLLNLWGVTYGLPNRYYPDEGRIVNNALAFGLGDLNPHYFNYPALSMYLLFALYILYFIAGQLTGLFASATDFQLLFFSDPSSFYLIGRIANALVGTATVALLYKLGKETFRDRKIGILAGAFLATLPYYVFLSHFIVTDILQTLFILAAYIFIIRILRTGKLKNYIWAGVLAGLGTATKYSPGVLILPIALAHIFYLFSRKEKERITFSRLVFPVAVSGFFLVLLFFIGSPYNFLDFKNFYDSLEFRSHLGAVGTFGTRVGTAWLVYPRLMFYHSFTILNRLDPLGFVFFGGLIWAAFKRRREDLLLVLYPLTIYLMVGSWSFGSYRYSLPFIPFFALLGARAAVEAGQALKEKIDQANLSRALAGGLNGFIALILILSLANTALLNRLLSGPDTRTRAREWVESNIPPGSRIAMEWDTEATVQLWETPDDIQAKIRAYESGEAETIHHTSEQMAEVHRMRLEAVPEKNYRITRIGGMDGTRVITDGYSLDRLREDGVEYFLTSGEVTMVFSGDRAREIYPEQFEFYRRVKEELPLLAVFHPHPLSSRGPEIRIYRLD